MHWEYEYDEEYATVFIEENSQDGPTNPGHLDTSAMSIWRTPALRYLKLCRTHCITIKIHECRLSALEFEGLLARHRQGQLLEFTKIHCASERITRKFTKAQVTA